MKQSEHFLFEDKKEIEDIGGGLTQVLKVGDRCMKPSHADHDTRCPTGEILIGTFSPAREGFIEGLT
ncbi:MAG: hypothetical protein V5788_10515 [Shewanella sp.]